MERLLSQNDGGEWYGSFTPQVNVSESDNEYEVTLDLPGMKPEDFDIEYKKSELWMSGERKQKEEEEGKNYHRMERRYGSFRRVIPLPTDVHEDKISADYRDGILRMTIPRTETARPRHIEVKSEGG